MNIYQQTWPLPHRPCCSVLLLVKYGLAHSVITPNIAVAMEILTI
jgi:hypothetical protein